jgi:hypothetical protein
MNAPSPESPHQRSFATGMILGSPSQSIVAEHMGDYITTVLEYHIGITRNVQRQHWIDTTNVL